MKRLYTLCLAVSMAFCLYSQPTLIAPDTTVSQDEYIDIGIHVNGFDSLLTLLFALEWDKEVLELDTTHSYRIPFVDPSYFGVSGDSILSFAWDDLTLSGVTIHPDTPIFRIRFKAIGEVGQETDLIFRDPPAPGTTIEAVQIINEEFVEVQVSLDDGKVLIDDMSAVPEIDPEHYAFALFPNPAQNTLVVDFSLVAEEQITFSLIGLDGRVHWSQSRTLPPGSHRIGLTEPVLPEAGMYLFKFRTQNGFFVRKFLVTD